MCQGQETISQPWRPNYWQIWKNPMLNSIIFEVELEDRHVKEYSANTITDNVLNQVDYAWFTLNMMKWTIDYQKGAATDVNKYDMYIVTNRVQRKIWKTTVGWQLLFQWRGHSESWIHMKDIKEFQPIEVAKFAKSRGISDEPAFAWWVPCMMRKRDVILSALKSQIRKTTHKYGTDIPTSIMAGPFWVMDPYERYKGIPTNRSS